MSDHTNPGTSDPASQAYPPPPQAASAPCSAAVTCSNGELQLPRIVDEEAAVGTGTGLAASSNGEGQYPGIGAAPAAALPGTGLAVEANAADAVQSPSNLTTVAEVVPPTVAGATRQQPGGLAANVYVR